MVHVDIGVLFCLLEGLCGLQYSGIVVVYGLNSKWRYAQPAALVEWHAG